MEISSDVKVLERMIYKYIFTYSHIRDASFLILQINIYKTSQS